MMNRVRTALYAAAISTAVATMIVAGGAVSNNTDVGVLSVQSLDSTSVQAELKEQLANQQAWLKETQATARVVELSNSDFTNGTVVVADDYVLVSEGDSSRRIRLGEGEVIVKLSEDVVFNPNPSSDQLPPHQSGYVRQRQYEYYDPKAYGIGFFAAIAIEREGVVLDLNGYSLSQSREHALQQRFYANVELADQPFIPKQGPADFGSEIKPAKRVAIINGHIGRASHHGIHGQMAENVLIQDVTFKDFEVASISLHGSKQVSLNRVDVDGNSTDVEVLGIYSAIRFIQPYIAGLPEGYQLNISSGAITKEQLQLRLAQINDAVINDDDSWRIDYPFAANNSGLTDGNVYGIVINAKGVAVNGFPDKFIPEDAAQDVYINSTDIRGIQADIREIPALSTGADQLSGAQTDVVGAVLQTYGLIGDNGEFTGNIDTSPVQLAQVMVAKAIADAVEFGVLPIDKNTISSQTVSWIEGGLDFDQIGARYVLNGDSMHHVNKGVTGLKLDGSQRAVVEDVSIKDVKNSSLPCIAYSDFENYMPLTELEKAYDRGAGRSVKGATQPGAGMNSARGISLASTHEAVIIDSEVQTVNSAHGPSFGAEVLYESHGVNLSGVSVMGLGENRAAYPADTTESARIRVATSSGGANIIE